MIFRLRNNISRSQQPAEKLKTVVISYPHRLDEYGMPLIRIRFVRTTAEPDFRYLNFNAWCMRIKRELMVIVKTPGI